MVNSERVQTRDFYVRVEITELPPGWTLLEQPDEVRVWVTGSTRAFTQLDRTSLRTLEIGPVQPGQRSWELRPGDFELGRGLSVERIEPEAIELALDPRVEVELPVQVNTRGQPPSGYELLGRTVTPSTVTVTMPESYAGDFDVVETETIDLNGLVRSTTRMVELNVRRPFVHYSREIPIVVTLDVALVEDERTYADLPIRAVGSAPQRCTPEPARMRLTLHGPQSIFDSLDPATLFASVDCDQAISRGQGRHLLEPRILNVPAGLEIRSLQPEIVTITVTPAPGALLPWLFVPTPAGAEGTPAPVLGPPDGERTDEEETP